MSDTRDDQPQSALDDLQKAAEQMLAAGGADDPTSVASNDPLADLEAAATQMLENAEPASDEVASTAPSSADGVDHTSDACDEEARVDAALAAALAAEDAHESAATSSDIDPLAELETKPEPAADFLPQGDEPASAESQDDARVAAALAAALCDESPATNAVEPETSAAMDPLVEVSAPEDQAAPNHKADDDLAVAAAAMLDEAAVPETESDGVLDATESDVSAGATDDTGPSIAGETLPDAPQDLDPALGSVAAEGEALPAAEVSESTDPMADLETAAAQMLDAAGSTADESTPPPDDSLDQQLAAMTAGIVDSETGTPESAPAPEAAVDDRVATGDSNQSIDEAARLAAEMMGESTTPSDDTRPVEPDPEPVAKSPTTEPKPVEKSGAELRARLKSAAGRGGSLLGPLAFKVCALISKPLTSQPKAIRDSVGWIGANTLFIACVLWIYLGFIRQPHTASAHAEEFNFESSTLPQPLPPPAEESHEAKGDAHAAEAHDSGGHGDAHGGGDAHGAKKPAPKKTPPKKPASPKKDAGHADAHGDAHGGH